MLIHVYSNIYNFVKEKRSSFGFLIADKDNKSLKSGRYHLSADYSKHQAWLISIKFLMLSIINPNEAEFVLHSTNKIVTEMFKLNESGNWLNNYQSNKEQIDEIRELTIKFKEFLIVEDHNSMHSLTCKELAKSK